MSSQTSHSDPDFPEIGFSQQTSLTITLVSAISYALVFVFFADAARYEGVDLYAGFALAAVLLIAAHIDLRTGLLLDILTLPLMVAGIAVSFVSELDWKLSVAGVVIGYGLVAGLALLWRRYRGYEGIGLGDAKLLAAGGAWVGAPLLPVILLIASGLGIFAALIVAQKPRTSGVRSALPFGPCLSFAIWVVWCAGETFYG